MAIKSQADQRRTQNMTDQHGRPWSAEVEKASGMPTALVQRLFDVPQAELVPPQKYLLFNAADATRVTIDYPQWIRDQDARMEEWEADRIRMSAVMPGVIYDPNKPPPPALLVLLGPRPMSSLPIRAMQQGNAWALGFSKEKPPEARNFFPDPVVAVDESVFSGPVFSQPMAPAAEQAAVDVLTALEARCPPDLVGGQRRSWLLGELKRLKEQATQPAEV